MSLNHEELQNTGAELRANLDASGWTEQDLAADTGLGLDSIPAILATNRPDPREVWLVRDRLETAVHAAGREPVPYKPVPCNKLTEATRASAAMWFGVRDER